MTMEELLIKWQELKEIEAKNPTFSIKETK